MSANKSPIDVEEALDGLKVRLSHPTHPTHRLVGILLFLTDELGHLPQPRQAESFMDEVLDLLEPVGDAVDLDGVRPELLEAAADVVLRISKSADALHYLRPLAGQFCSWCVFQYARVGATDVLARLVGCDAPAASSLQSGSDVADFLRVHRPQCAPRFETIAAFHHERFASSGRASSLNAKTGNSSNATSTRCRFPVVADVPHVGAGGPLWLGYNRTLACRVTGRTPTMDEFDVLFEHDGDSARMLSAPLSAARGLLKETHPGLLSATYRGRFALESGGGAHSGASAGLAMTLLAWCEIIRFSDDRRQFRLSTDIAFTGVVDGDGRVLPVADDLLAPKVDAAFFSDVRILVLPEAQQHLARERVEHLRRQFPNRKLGLRGILHASDVLADRRIVKEVVRSRPAHAARLFWRNKSLVVLTAIALAVGGASMWVIENRVDPYPESWRYQDGSYIVENRYGDELMRYTLNSTETYLGRHGQNYETAALVDVDGDGFREFIWHEPRRYYTGSTAHLHITDGRSLIVRSHAIFDLELPYDLDLSIIHGRMTPVGLIAADLDQNGRVEIYSSAFHEYYPAIIVKTDALTGEVLDIYHHPGAIHAMNIHDVDGDGFMELLLGGTNNAFRQAVIIVLDPRDIGGFGPGQGTYQPGPGPTLHEKAYLRLPVTETGKLLPTAFPLTNGIRPMSEDSAVVFHSQESLVSQEGGRSLPGSLLLTLDEELRPISVGTNDSYDKAWARARELGHNPAPLDNAFKVGYMQAIERLTPDGWVPVELSPRSKAWNLPE
ncbi:MAG: hypothetical protein RIE53_09265 [Rhodothermales bacterium]